MAATSKQKSNSSDDSASKYQNSESNHESAKDSTFTHINDLQWHGISESDLERLLENGFCTVQSISHATVRKLMEIRGISEEKALKLKAIVNDICPIGFKSAKAVGKEREKVVMISTGSKDLDAILNGGIETGSLTEVFGEFRTGKTQLCHTMCVTCQLPMSEGGFAGKAMYIDTEGTFRPQKIKAIAERFNLDADAVLENVAIARVHNSEQQIDVLKPASAIMAGDRYGLLIIDSGTALFRTDYLGQGKLYERQMHLAQFLRQLTLMAEEFGIAVMITNQVASSPDGLNFGQESTKPIGGNIIAHASTTRLRLRKGRGANRICQIFDSPSLPEKEANFLLGEAGVQDQVD